MSVSKRKSLFEDSNILITGGTGTIGSNLVINLLKYNPKIIRIFSNDENSIFEIEQLLGDLPNLRYLIGDIRDKDRLILATEDIDFVFHAAALKHVPYCEYNPFEAIKTNVIGTQNLIEACLYNNVKRVIGISTDKAVNPYNTMGTTKLLAEKLIINANFYKGNKKTILSCVRFGNVLDSRGSILPIIRECVKKDKPIKLTNPNMTRFVITIDQAINLVLTAAEMSKGGEIFVLKMRSLKIKDLIDAAIEVLSKKSDGKKYNNQVIDSEIRLGEKIHEDLISLDESACIFENDDLYIIIPHVTRKRADEISWDLPISKIENYNSNQVIHMQKDEIKVLIEQLNRKELPDT